MRVAIIGCGFVADYYMSTISGHPELSVIGAFDRNDDSLARFGAFHSVATYASLEQLLADERVELVLNLTNPRSHYEVSRACLLAGKHVYSEKPLAMEMAQARELVELAKSSGLLIASAPCSLLGETAQTIWRAIRKGKLGQVRLVYAEMDEGMVYSMPYKKWASASGAPWPYKDEFEVGTTIEHAGYVLTWLPAFFGPAKTLTGFSATLAPDKGTPLDTISPDFASAVIRFESGVVARITCSLLAPHDHSLRIVGDKGVLATEDTWYYTAPVHMRRWFNFRRSHVELPRRKIKLASKGARYKYRGTQQMDFARGPAELANALAERRPCRLSADYSLHCNELVLALNNACEHGSTYVMTTTFDPVQPMPWAKD
ncbi:MAG TPA: Gfo/Idh/MocA family oxidoreductase [Roseiflexaceae bacterium]|nr:Gfo/Idh/MocA family oxidoreductase [Roseiflexaceae bacterium]